MGNRPIGAHELGDVVFSQGFVARPRSGNGRQSSA